MFVRCGVLASVLLQSVVSFVQVAGQNIAAGYLHFRNSPNLASQEVEVPPRFQERKLKGVPVAVARDMGWSACALSFGLHSFRMRKI